MDLSPNDVRNYKFSSQMRGYSRDDVDNFVEQVANAFETAKQEQLRLSMEAAALRSQLAGLKQFEDTIKNAAIDARRNADLTMANAKQEAEMILSKARAEAENLMAKMARQSSDIETQITRLSMTRKSYLSKIRGMIQAHLEMVEEAEGMDIVPPPSHSQKETLDITESQDMTSAPRETVATKPSRDVFKTEEANAPDESAASLVVPEQRPDSGEELKGVIRPEEPHASIRHEIDPELAAALESYKKVAAMAPLREHAAVTPPRPSVRPGQVIITTKRAEDVPNGFIAKEDLLPEDPITDRLPTPGTPAENPLEPNLLREEKPSRGKAPLSPEAIAHELDEVAAKVEEEISRAEKN